MYEMSSSEEFERDCYAVAFGLMVQHLTRVGDKLAASDDRQLFIIPQFVDTHLSSIPIHTYIYIFGRSVTCFHSTFLFAFVYLTRVCAACPRTPLCSITVHNIVLACLVLAVKYTEDQTLSNRIYSRIGNASLSRLNFVEHFVARVLGFRFYISDSEIFRIKSTFDGVILAERDNIFHLLCHLPRRGPVEVFEAVCANDEESFDVETDLDSTPTL
jgi:hypothetical protein